MASDQEWEDFIYDRLSQDDADELEARVAEHPAHHVRMLSDRTAARRSKIVYVNFYCPVLVLGKAGAVSTKPVESRVGEFALSISFEEAADEQLVVLVSAIWRGAIESQPTTPPTLRFFRGERELGAITEWRPGRGNGRWIGDASIVRAARVGIRTTDQIRAAFA